ERHGRGIQRRPRGHRCQACGGRKNLRHLPRNLCGRKARPSRLPPVVSKTTRISLSIASKMMKNRREGEGAHPEGGKPWKAKIQRKKSLCWRRGVFGGSSRSFGKFRECSTPPWVTREGTSPALLTRMCARETRAMRRPLRLFLTPPYFLMRDSFIIFSAFM